MQGRIGTRKRDSEVREKKMGDDQGRRKREVKVQGVCFFFIPASRNFDQSDCS